MSIIENTSIVIRCRLLLDAATLLHDPSRNTLMFWIPLSLLFCAFFDEVQRTAYG